MNLARTSPAMPWDPLPAESPDEYAAFWAWLQSSPRPAPADVNPNLTPTWRERANAYDLQRDVLASVGGTAGPKALAEMILWGYLQIAAQETVKLVRASQLGERVMTAKDLREVPLLIAELAKLAPPAETGQIDLSLATPEEQDLLLKALPLLERIRRTKK
jgi:hypothetical protein